MIDGRRQVVVDRVGERVAVADGDRREVHAVGHVADRIDGLDAALRILVDNDRARVVELHARGLEAEALRIRVAADREQDDVGFHCLAGRQGRADGAAGLLQLRERGFHRQPGSAAFHFYMHVSAQVIVESAQQLVAAMQDAHRASEAVEDVREFERHVPAADDERALGELRQQERFIR